MPGFVDEIKSIFDEDTIKGLAYAAGVGIGSGALASFLLRVSNAQATAGKIIKGTGILIGAGIGAYIADRYLKDRKLAYAGLFGALLPPLYNYLTTKINPEEVGQKLALGLAGEWRHGATAASAPVITVQPVEVRPAPANVGAPVPP